MTKLVVSVSKEDGPLSVGGQSLVTCHTKVAQAVVAFKLKSHPMEDVSAQQDIDLLVMVQVVKLID